jgi:hypothetical protein
VSRTKIRHFRAEGEALCQLRHNGLMHALGRMHGNAAIFFPRIQTASVLHVKHFVVACEFLATKWTRLSSAKCCAKK